jgi:DNA-binding LacI/PurR family transcriptional regulator
VLARRTAEADAWAGCQQLIAQRVDGVFFAPLERTPNRIAVNRRIAELAAARVPVVRRSLHRAVSAARPPDPSASTTGSRRDRHQLSARSGCTRIAFVGEPDAASTVDARQSAIARPRATRARRPRIVLRGDHRTLRRRQLMARQSPDAIVAATDRTRAVHADGDGSRLPRPSTADRRHRRHAQYAELLPVPLTTLKQPCQRSGSRQWRRSSRIAAPDLPARDVLLTGGWL